MLRDYEVTADAGFKTILTEVDGPCYWSLVCKRLVLGMQVSSLMEQEKRFDLFQSQSSKRKCALRLMYEQHYCDEQELKWS